MASGRVLIGGLSVLGLLGGLWLLTNYEPQRVGIIFTALSLVGLVVAAIPGVFARLLGYRSADGGVADLRVKRQLALGVACGVVILLVSIFYPLTIGLPQVTYSVANKALAITGRAIISIFVAPLVEEVFFLFVVPFLLFCLFMGLTKSKAASIALTLLAASVAFAGFHYLAYGGNLLVSGAFVGAAIFRLITLLLVLVIGGMDGFTISNIAPVILTTMMMHAIFNAAIFSQQLVVVGL